MAFATGLSSVLALAEESKSSSAGGYKFFSMKDKEEVLVRFVTENVIGVPTLTFKSKDGKQFVEIVDCEFPSLENPRSNPMKGRTDVDQWTSVSKKGEPYPKKFSTQGLCILVKREEYSEKSADGRTVIKIRDLEEEFKDSDGNVVKGVAPYFVKMSSSTFWSNLAPVVNRFRGDENGRITTRDFLITRKGASTDTTYLFQAEQPEEFTGPNEAEERYRAIFGDTWPDLIKWVEYRASEEFYKKNVLPLIPGYLEESPSSEDATTASDASVSVSAESVEAEEHIPAEPEDMKRTRVAAVSSTPSVGSIADQLRARLPASSR